MPDPKRNFAVEVVRRLREAGYQALWAGGCVRDLLLGRTPEDYDVATDARPDDVRDLFGKRRTLAVGESFGVIIVRGPKSAGQVEVATFRTESSYLDGRRPSQVAFSTAEEDARRRDFTINGMFYDPLESRVLDFVGGEADLSAGIVRAIGEPRERMAEDKLRMLRAVRFAATLEFDLDPATAEAVRDMAAELLVVSAERIAQELRRMLVHPQRARAVGLAHELRLLHVIVPELYNGLARQSDRPFEKPGFSEKPGFWAAPPEVEPPEWQKTLRMLELIGEVRRESAGEAPFELAMAALLHSPAAGETEPARSDPLQRVRPPEGGHYVRPEETARRICRRLRFSNDETDRICWLLAHRGDLDDAPAAAPARLKRLMAHRWFSDLLTLVHARLLAHNADLTPVLFCEEYLARTPAEEINPPALLTGDDLIELGLTPGPHFKDILEAVRDAQLNGEIGSRDEAVELALRMGSEAS